VSSVGSLGDVLAALLAQVQGGRVGADLRAAEIAALYAENEILRGFPVPIFRIGEVVLDLPVVIQELGSPHDKPVRAFPDREHLAGAAVETLQRLDLASLNVAFAGDEREEVQRRLEDAMADDWKLYENGRLTGEALLSPLAQRTVEAARNALRSGPKAATREIPVKITGMLDEALRLRFRDDLRRESELTTNADSTLQVAISSEAIREAGGVQGGAVTRITIKLFEEAGHWTVSATGPGGEPKLKLVVD
jgi:hypothetical protein